MPLVKDLSKAQLAFQVAGSEVDQYSVIRFRGTEGLCQLYRFEIEMERAHGETSFDEIIGKAGVLSINTSRGERYFHGIVSRFELIDESYERSLFRAELVPTVWLMTHRYTSRIFQNKTTPDIIREVLEQAGLKSDQFKLDVLEKEYEPREYCVQYRETDYNFIARLMEDEGIWWHFEQSKDGHVLVLADSPAGYKAIEGNPSLPLRRASGMNTDAYTDNSSASTPEHVHRFRLSSGVRGDRVVLNEYDFKNPKLDLKTGSDSGSGVGEFNDFPGRYTTQARGNELANIRWEEFTAGFVLGIGQSHSYRLAPGRTFELTEHGSGADGSYLLTSVTHQGKQAPTHTTTGTNGRTSALDARIHQSLQLCRGHNDSNIRELAEGLLQLASRLGVGDATNNRTRASWNYRNGQVSQDAASTAAVLGAHPLDGVTIANQISDYPGNALVDFDAPVYECRFECIPSSLSYRPPRVTPWPVIGGTQTARVVGPKDEEIFVDEFGRVKVHFEWDLKGNHGENDSCWIRVCQGMAGGAYGIMFIPRVGQEVIVGFLNGDPDKPVIIGRVYNGDHMPPYKLPEEKTKSCIKTHSSKGGGGCNEIRFEDAKDKEQLFIQAQRQMDTRVKASHMHTIGGEYHLDIGKNYLQHVKADKLVTIDGNHISRCVTRWQQVDGDKVVYVSGEQTRFTGGFLYEGSADHRIRAKGLLDCKATEVRIEAAATIELVVGGSSIVITGGGIWIEAPNVYINSGRGPAVAIPSKGEIPAPDLPLPAGADQSEPGRDTRYDGGEDPLQGKVPEDIPGHDFEDDEPDDKETTFIDIELVDDDGKPVPGERYRVTDSAGKIRNGSLDKNGFAHVTNIAPGACLITFPNLDQSVWKRL